VREPCSSRTIQRLLDAYGKTVQIVGGDKSLGAYWSSLARLADPEADLRILLFHFPDVVRHLPPGAFDLVLAGHLHGGQICIPTPRGKVRLEHSARRALGGLARNSGRVLHVSRGLGTSFVPFRFLARPEATRLVLRSAAPDADPAPSRHRSVDRARAAAVCRLRLLAVAPGPRGGEGQVGRADRGRLGPVGDALLRGGAIGSWASSSTGRPGTSRARTSCRPGPRPTTPS
jgi:hypothetical protein